MRCVALVARSCVVVALLTALAGTAAAAPGPSRREARRLAHELCSSQVFAEDPPMHSAGADLYELAMRGPSARSGVLDVVRDRHPAIAVCAAEILVGIEEPRVWPLLRRRVERASPREFAALDLLAAAADPAALPAALALSSSPETRARSSAIAALGRLDDPRSRTRLRAMLSSEADLYAVASAVGQLRDVESVPALIAHAQRAPTPLPPSMLSVAAALVRIGTDEALGAAAALVARHPPSIELDEALAPAVDDLRSRSGLAAAAERWTEMRIDVLVPLTQRAEVLPSRVEGKPVTREVAESSLRGLTASKAWTRLDAIDHPRARDLVRATAAEGTPLVLAGLTNVASVDVLLALVRGDRLPDDRSRSSLAWNLYHRCHRACLDDILLAFRQIRDADQRFHDLAFAIRGGATRCRDAIPVAVDVQDACREVKRALSAMAVDPGLHAGRWAGHWAQPFLDHPVVVDPLVDRAMTGDMDALSALGDRRDPALVPRLRDISAAATGDDRLAAVALAQIRTGAAPGADDALETLARMTPCGVAQSAAAVLAELQVQRSPRYQLESRLTDVAAYEARLRPLLATRCRR